MNDEYDDDADDVDDEDAAAAAAADDDDDDDDDCQGHMCYSDTEYMSGQIRQVQVVESPPIMSRSSWCQPPGALLRLFARHMVGQMVIHWSFLPSWWFQPLWKILVKMGIFPK